MTSESQPESSAQESAETTAADQLRERFDAVRDSGDGDEQELELWSGGYSPKAMIGTWVLLGIVSVALLVAAVMASPLVLVPLALIWIIGGLVYASRRFGMHYELTNQRFIHQKGILTRRTDRIEVIDVDDVSFSQGPIERVFGVGTIVLTSSDRTHPELSMIGIADAREVAGLIDDVRRKERRRRSVHIEAI